MSEFEIKWGVDDGYAGGTRPHHTNVSLDDFSHEASVEEIEAAIVEIAEEDFLQTISCYVKNAKELAAEIFAALQERNKAEVSE